jgi:hypothetical protein
MNTHRLHYWGEEADPFQPTAEELALVLSQTADMETTPPEEAPPAESTQPETTPW